MGAFIWVIDGMAYGVGRTAEEAKQRGMTVLKDSTNLVLSTVPEAAPLFNLDAAISKGVAVEYAYIGGSWPFPGVDPTSLLLQHLGDTSIHTVTTLPGSLGDSPVVPVEVSAPTPPVPVTAPVEELAPAASPPVPPTATLTEAGVTTQAPVQITMPIPPPLPVLSGVA